MVSSMPESSSRNRSVSVGDSGLPTHERKRPRLSESQVDLASPSTTHALVDSTEVRESDRSGGTVRPSVLHTPPASPLLMQDTTTVASPTSRVTINTRPLSSQSISCPSVSQPEHDTDPVVHNDRQVKTIQTALSDSSVVVNMSDEDSSQTLAGEAAHPISITSSPDVSPRAKAAHLTMAIEDEKLPIHFVHTFSTLLDRETSAASAMVFHVATYLQAAEPMYDRPFFRLKSWISRCAVQAEHWTWDLLEDEIDFWKAIPRTINEFLKRRAELPGTFETGDLVGFFVAYAQLTNRMANFDVQRLQSYPSDIDPKEMQPPQYNDYLATLMPILQPSTNLYSALRFSTQMMPNGIIMGILDTLLSSDAPKLLGTLSRIFQELARFLPIKPALLQQTLELARRVLSLFRQFMARQNVVAAETSGQRGELLKSINDLWTTAHEMLEQGIVKQQAWLTIDSSPTVLECLSPVHDTLVLHDRLFAAATLRSVKVDPDRLDARRQIDVAPFAFTVSKLEKFIRQGRMELRVYGIESLSTELVRAWTDLNQQATTRHKNVVEFLNEYIQNNDLIKYICGVDSHPQIVQRSRDVIGFLCISNCWRSEDTETIWQAVLDSQDPRMGSAVLDVFHINLTHLNPGALSAVYQKLLTMPFDCIDQRILNFSQTLLQLTTKKIADRPAEQPEKLHSTLIQLCLRLLRECSTPERCSTETGGQTRVMVTDYLAREHHHLIGDFRTHVSVEEGSEILKQLCQDIANHTAFACGSVVAMTALLRSLQEHDFLAAVQESDYTRLLLNDLTYLAQHRVVSEPDAQQSLWVEFETRLTSLAPLVVRAPVTFSQDLINILWHDLLMSELPFAIRTYAWGVLADAFSNSTSHNPLLDTLVDDYLSKLPASHIDKPVLNFVERSVEYDVRLSSNDSLNVDEVIPFPSLERIWRIVLGSPSGTVENEATDFIIHFYLNSELVLRQTSAGLEHTYSLLIDRCVNQVLAAARQLHSQASCSNEVVASTDPGAVQTADSAARLCFNRSLLFLRRFLHAIKNKPNYLKRAKVDIKPFLDKFPVKGSNTIDLWLLVTGHPTFQDASRCQWPVGTENTGSELWQFLSELTGWTQFNILKAGQRMLWRAKDLTLQEMSVTQGPVTISKMIGAVEQGSDPSHRSSSPVDSKITHHFDALHDLLGAEDDLAHDVYKFLVTFPSQQGIARQIISMDWTASELLPVARPYKLLYYVRALRSCIEEESLSPEPRSTFLRISVQALVDTLQRLDEVAVEAQLHLTMSYDLLDALLLALRAKVPPEVSAEYFAERNDFVERVLNLWGNMSTSQHRKGAVFLPETSTRIPFEVIVEAALHEERLREFVDNNGRIVDLFAESLVSSAQIEVRQGFLDVIFSMTGEPSKKAGSSKLGNTRSPRVRHTAENMMATMKILWRMISRILPVACQHADRSREYFEAALTIWKQTAEAEEESQLRAYFDHWKSSLVSHSHQQQIGYALEDFVILGLARLLCHCCRVFASRDVSVPDSSEFVQSLFVTLLFPPLSITNHDSTTNSALIIDSQARESLYDLVGALAQQDVRILDMATSELTAPLIPDDTFFHRYSANERQEFRSDQGYAGLRNLSNTCYLNSLLSQLFMNIDFRDFILNVNVIDGSKQKLLVELGRVFAYMQNSIEKSVCPEKAVESIVQYDGEQIDVAVQMDVDEFFNLLFDRLESQILDPAVRTKFKAMYGGQLVQQIKSKECEHVSERFEPFSAVQVEIRGKLRLEEGLRAYVEGEVLQGENKYSCSGCGKHVDAVKRACLKDVPDNLIFNLKRFDYDIMTGTRAKINDEFYFPSDIDMAPYTIDALTHPDKTAPADVFELVGVIVHSGTAESGHYYSYIRQRPSTNDGENRWLQFNDQDVTKFDTATMRESCFGGFDPNMANMQRFYNGYMLFYQRQSSIRQCDREYQTSGALARSPVTLPLTRDLGNFIRDKNELFMRSYVVQDPVHARFIRLVLELNLARVEGRCSPAHHFEDTSIISTLNYMKQISSRWKESPEIDKCIQLLVERMQSCPRCAYTVAKWLIADENVADTMVRAFYQIARKAFSFLTSACLWSLQKHREEPTASSNGSDGIPDREGIDQLISACVQKLSDGVDHLQRHPRAWDSYFDVLIHVLDLADDIGVMMVEVGLLEKVLEIVHVHVPQLAAMSRRLRAKYADYLALREKNRSFNHVRLMDFLAALLSVVDLRLVPTEETRRNSGDSLGLSVGEAQLLGLLSKPVQLGWLRKAILGRSNGDAMSLIVRGLCRYPGLINPLCKVLAAGLAEERQIAASAAFLQPALVFLQHSSDVGEIVHLVNEAIESIQTINDTFGEEYIQFLYSVTRSRNSKLEINEAKFANMVLDRVKHWVPTMIMYPNDPHHNVRNDTISLLNEILFSRLDRLRVSSQQRYEYAIARVVEIAECCASHARKTFLSQSRERQVLQPGQADQVVNLVDACLNYAEVENAEEEERASEIQAVMQALRNRAEIASNNWQDLREASSELEQISELESLTGMSP